MSSPSFSAEDELRFMSEVDAALHRRGHRWIYVLAVTIYLMVGSFLIRCCR